MISRGASMSTAGPYPWFYPEVPRTRLVYFEQFGDIRDAIAREKQIKGWVRARKLELIEARNPTWDDLAEHWFHDLFPFFLIRGTTSVILSEARRRRA